jgi:hypothetical protein
MYVNPRFGFQMSYPPELVASPEPENGDGREFHTRDKTFSVAAFGHYLVDTTLEACWQEDLKQYGDRITYKKKARDWFVVSGVKDGKVFYHKFSVMGDSCAELLFSYPQDKASQYDPWVERIVKGYVPFLKHGHDHVIK